MAQNPGALRPAILKLALACDLRQVRHTTQTVHRFLVEQGCDEETLMACDLALVEGCNNAIKYVTEKARTRPVVLEAICDSDRIELRVTDHTAGFDLPERVKLPDPESESGRGLYLMQSLMDSATYLRGRGENMLILRKTRKVKDKTAPPVPAGQNQSAEDERVISELLEELSSCYESLSAIFRYSTEQGKITSLKAFARRLLADLQHIVGADWFVFRAVPQGESRLVVLVASEPSLIFEPLALQGLPGKEGPAELRAAVSRRAVWFNDLQSLEPTDPLQGVKGSACGLVHPVFVGENLIGTLAIGASSAKPTSASQPPVIFTAGQTNVIGTFAHFLAVQIVNSRLQEEMVANRLVAREIELAGSIQQSFLLKKIPQIPGLDIAGFCQSAHQVGGDFYDVVKISDSSALLAIADVMGKGVLASMFAAILRTVLRAMPELTRQPAALLSRVNQLMFDELSSVEMFITAQLVCVDSQEHKLTIASAGHCPLLVALENGVKTFSPEGPPLGVEADAQYVSETVQLPERSRALLYTDGITEAANPAGERYGQQRLMDWLQQASGKVQSAALLKQDLSGVLTKFRGTAALNDDQTFLILLRGKAQNNATKNFGRG